MATPVVDRGPCTIYVFHPSAEKELERRIRREFEEMPGLRLTADQAVRLWSPGDHTCLPVLNTLVEERFLRVDEYGRYAHHHHGC